MKVYRQKLNLSTSHHEINDHIRKNKGIGTPSSTKRCKQNKCKITEWLIRARNEIIFLRFPGVFMFDMLMELVNHTYIHLIPFPNLKVLKICLLSTHSCCQPLRHVPVDYFQRIFNGWVIFCQLFLRLDLIPANGYLLHKMPNAFIIQWHISRVNIWFGNYW